jgi:hypothetical protein
MKLTDLLNPDATRRLLEELTLTRKALESIAVSLARATEIPAPPPRPAKPLGPEAIGEYATAIQDLEGEDADAIRERLRASGLTDHAIEELLVTYLTGREED